MSSTFTAKDGTVNSRIRPTLANGSIVTDTRANVHYFVTEYGIIPVYKVERYLDACVESVVRQSYADLEILLVDDGSPDRCPALCDWKL